MMTRFALLSLLALVACQNQNVLQDPGAPAIREMGELSSEQTLDTTRDPVNKSDLETEDLDALRAELATLNKDLAEIRQDLVQADATMVVPDESISTPRALPTDGVVKIPDSLEEETAIDRAIVEKVRVGTHPNKTRLVFDIKNHGQSKPNINLSGKLLSFQIDNAKWPEANKQFSSLEDQVGIFKVDQEKDDLNVTILLNKDMRIQSTDLLPPSETGGARRLVIDLAPL